MLKANKTLKSLSANLVIAGELGSKAIAPGLARNESLTVRYESVSLSCLCCASISRYLGTTYLRTE